MSDLKVEVSYVLGVSRQLATQAGSNTLALTAGTRAVRLTARTAEAKYVIGDGAQTAGSTSHYLPVGVPFIIGIPEQFTAPNIAATRIGIADGILEISELHPRL